MGISRIKLVFVFSFCLFMIHTTLSGGNSGGDGLYAEIDSIIPDQPKYAVEKEISFVGIFMIPVATDEYSIIWDFGDGNIDTGTLTTSRDIYANPGRCSPYKNICFSKVKATTRYLKPGAYTVTFSVKNNDGLILKDSKTITVGEKGKE